MDHWRPAIDAATKHALAHHKHIFSADAIRLAAAEYFGLGFEATYFANCRPELLSAHLYGYLSAKSNHDFLFKCFSPGTGDGLFITTQRKADMRAADRRIDEKFLSGAFTAGVVVRCYYSTVRPAESPLLTPAMKEQRECGGLCTPGFAAADANGIVIYVVSVSPFRKSDHGATAKPIASAALRLGSEYFYAQNANQKNRVPVLARYDETLRTLADRVSRSSVAHVTKTGAADAGARAGTVCLQLGFKALEGSAYFSSLSTLITQIPKVRFVKKIVTTFSDGSHIYTFYVDGEVSVEDIRRASGFVGLLPTRLSSQKAIIDLYVQEKLSPIECLFATASAIFAFYFTKGRASSEYASLLKSVSHEPAAVRRLNTLNDTLFREIVHESSITSAVAKHLALFKAIFAAFVKDCTAPAAVAASASASGDSASFDGLSAQIARIPSRTEQEMFRSFLRFAAAVVRTNMFKVDKAALAFRLNPATFFEGLDFPRVPFGIYLVVGAHFRGFHVRFHDIARGGIRIIRSTAPDPEITQRRYATNRTNLFQETFNLAYTQMLKNKDIPESGAKGTILVSVRATESNKVLYLQYIDAILDLAVPDVPGVVAKRSGSVAPIQGELLFFGPDEGTADDFPNTCATHAKRSGYKQWQSVATGKTPVMGGIPHDTYGMTTRSIRQYAVGVYRELGLKEERLTKFLIGGPSGDLGSNEIKMGKETIVAICDGDASVHDPAGINRAELVRLATARKSLAEFNKAVLSPKGFKVGVQEHGVTLPDGTLVANGTLFRDTFHFTKYTDADVFVPCGGRPASIALESVPRMFKTALPGVTGDALLAAEGGATAAGKKPLVDPAQLRWKYIIEGGNLFFTHDARIASERAGFVHFKDAATNKGGVTSSSLEVFVGLALTTDEHKELMCTNPTSGQASPFYEKYVQDIIQRVEDNARREFECTWKDSAGGKMSKTHATDALSLKILRFKEFVQNSSLSTSNANLFRFVIERYTPETLRARVSFKQLLERVPRPYLEAIFSSQIASGFVFATGISGNEFDFFQYMLGLTQKADAHCKAKVSRL